MSRQYDLLDSQLLFHIRPKFIKVTTPSDSKPPMMFMKHDLKLFIKINIELLYKYK